MSADEARAKVLVVWKDAEISSAFAMQKDKTKRWMYCVMSLLKSTSSRGKKKRVLNVGGWCFSEGDAWIDAAQNLPAEKEQRIESQYMRNSTLYPDTSTMPQPKTYTPIDYPFSSGKAENEQPVELCYLCNEPIEWPNNDDPQFIDDSIVRSKCHHYIRPHPHKPITTSEVEKEQRQGEPQSNHIFSKSGFHIEGIGTASCDVCDGLAKWADGNGAYLCTEHYGHPEPGNKRCDRKEDEHSQGETQSVEQCPRCMSAVRGIRLWVSGLTEPSCKHEWHDPVEPQREEEAQSENWWEKEHSENYVATASSLPKPSAVEREEEAQSLERPKLNQYGLTGSEWTLLVDFGCKLHDKLMDEPEGEDHYDGQSLSIMQSLVEVFKAGKVSPPSPISISEPSAVEMPEPLVSDERIAELVQLLSYCEFGDVAKDLQHLRKWAEAARKDETK